MEPAPHLPARLVDTAQHITLLKDKQRRLREAELDSIRQFLVALKREMDQGRVTMANLLDAYMLVRGDGPYPEGLRETWLEETGVPHTKLAGLAEREARMTIGPWSGHYPLHPDEQYPLKGQDVVYLLYSVDNRPIYVGSTGHLRYRLTAHHKIGKRWDTWDARLCADRAEAYRVEARFLRQYLPDLNVQGAR